MKKALCAFIPLVIMACGHSPLYSTKDLCSFKFSDDMKRYQSCMDEQVAYARKMYTKLIYLNIIDEDGKTLPYAKSRVEYKIFNVCWMINQPDYWLTNYCFDTYLNDYEKTGRWGLNTPSWQW